MKRKVFAREREADAVDRRQLIVFQYDRKNVEGEPGQDARRRCESLISFNLAEKKKG